MDTIDVKLLSPDDALQIEAVEKACFPAPWSQNAILESFGNNTVFFGVFSGSTLSGYCGLQMICGEGYITNLAVLPQYRRTGVAKSILSAVINYSAENKLKFISLEVRVSNTAAVALYKSFNFENAGIRKNFYRLPKEDAYIMTRNL